MTKLDQFVEETSERQIVITQLFDALRELVFEVWTDPKHVVQWWGWNGFTNTNKEMDVKSGGVWRFTMHGPDGVDYPNKIVYQEVVKPERLVYTHGEDMENDLEGGNQTLDRLGAHLAAL